MDIISGLFKLMKKPRVPLSLKNQFFYRYEISRLICSRRSVPAGRWLIRKAHSHQVNLAYRQAIVSEIIRLNERLKILAPHVFRQNKLRVRHGKEED
jgi:hypothetical protein